MKNTRFLILLTFVFSSSSYGSGREMEPVDSPVSQQTIAVETAKPVDPFLFLEQQGIEMKGLQRKAIGKTFDLYYLGDLQVLLDDLTQKGVMAKCTKAKHVDDILKTLKVLGQQGTWSQFTRRDIIRKLAESGVLAKCQDVAAVIKVLTKLGKLPMTCLAFLEWTMKSAAIGTCANSDEVIILSQRVQDLNHTLHQRVIQAMADMNIFRHCSNLNQTLRIFWFAKELEARNHTYLWDWLNNTKALALCTNLAQVHELFQLLETIADENTDSVLQYLKHTEIIALCSNIEQVHRFLLQMHQMVSNETGHYITNLGKRASQEFENMEQVFQFMAEVKDNRELRSSVEGWLGIAGSEKVRLVAFLRTIKALETEVCEDLFLLMKDEELFRDIVPHEARTQIGYYMESNTVTRELILRHLPEKTEQESEFETEYNYKEFAKLIETLKAYSSEERRQIFSWPLPEIEKVSNSREYREGKTKIAQQIKVLNFFQTYKPDIRAQILAWIGRTAFPKTVHYGNAGVDHILKPFESFSGYHIHNGLGWYWAWLSSSKWFEKSQHFLDLVSVVKFAKKGKDFCLNDFTSTFRSLIKRKLIDEPFVRGMLQSSKLHDCMFLYAAPLFAPEEQLYDGGNVSLSSTERYNLNEFYLFLLSIGFVDKRINDYFEKELSNPQRRKNLLDLMVRELGATHELTQQFLKVGKK